MTLPQAVLAELARMLGRLAHARFDTFDLQRPLVELVWSGEHFSIDVQRLALAQALEDAQRYATQPAGWLYLCGPCGAGKSHLAAAIANTLAARGQGVTYASVPDLLRFVRRGFGERTADDRLDALMAIEVLILDDLGAEHLTAWAAEQLFVLLNARYLTDRATVLTSNAPAPVSRTRSPPKDGRCRSRLYDVTLKGCWRSRHARSVGEVLLPKNRTCHVSRSTSMYYIIEITSRGSETFLEGFEDIGEAWDVVSRLQCEARRRRRKVRYEVR